jgi:5-hydroxyisourate hydrolase-like protein (transthyretin family)
MRTAALFLLLAGALTAQQGSIEGVVLNQASGQPLPGVHIRLLNQMIVESATQAWGAATDAAGHFSIAAIPPGTYTVELERTGFLQVPGTGFMKNTEIDVRPGEHLAGRQLAMWPLIQIAGRVVNQYGDPAAGAQVQASTEAVRAGAVNARLLGPYGIKTTDERGQFRLFAPPGKYYVVAGPPILPSMGPAEIRTDGTSDLAYVSTYYSDASDASTATTVEVKPGGEVTGIEIHLRSGAVRRNLSVSGVVTGISACAPLVAYQYGETPDRVSMGNSGGRVDAGGRFSFDNLPPGYLRLLARCSSGDTELQSEVVETHLEPPGVSGVQLALTPGGVVTGTLEIVGGGPAAAPAGKVTVKLVPTSGIGFGMPGPMGQPSGTVDQDGAFRIAGVTPGRFQVSVDPMPENGYVKAVLLDNTAVSGGTLDFSHGVRGPRIKITVSRNGAQISGEVRDADGGPLLNPNVMVSLVPEPNQSALSRRGASVIDGHYTLKSVPPGKYQLCALDIFRTIPDRPAGSTCSALPAATETLDVSEGARVTKDLKAAAQEATDAQPKQ